MTDQDDAAAADVETRRSERRGHPAIATSIIAFLLMAAAVGSGGEATHISGTAERFGYVAGGIMFAVVLWTIAYFITIKRASSAWKIGSFILLALLGTLGPLARLGAGDQSIQADVSNTANQFAAAIKQGDDIQPIRVDHDAGPFARMSANTANMILASSRAFSAEAEASGASNVLALRGLRRDTPVLDHCDRIRALVGHAAAIRDSFPQYVARARADGNAAIAKGQISDRGVDSYIAGMERARPRFERQWTLLGQNAAEGAALCRVLARRHWKEAPSGKVLFTDDGDVREANAILGRIRAAETELAALSDANTKAAKEDLEKLRRRAPVSR